MPPNHSPQSLRRATPRTPLLLLALLCLGGAAQAQGTPEMLPLGDVQILPGPGTVLLLSPSAMALPVADPQTGRCRPLLANGTLGAPLVASNPPILAGLQPGQPYTCELEYTRGAQNYLGQAFPPVVVMPDSTPGLTPPIASDDVTGLQGSPAANSLRLAFTPPAAPSTRIDGYVAICLEAPGGPPGPILPTRYVAARGAGSPITMGGLLPNQLYLCGVSPYNAASAAPLPTVIEPFTTLAAPSPQPVPTLSGWGLLLLSPLTLLAALPRLRRIRAMKPRAKNYRRAP